MRKRLLIGLALYLALGAVFGLVTDRQDYMCPPRTVVRDGYALDGAPDGEPLVESSSRDCFPIFNAGDRVRWVAITTPAWLPLVVRNVVRGEGIAIGSVILGPTNFEEED